MHHFIYPQKDVFVTNLNGLDDKNFGIDELLQVGTQNTPQRILSPTKDYLYTNVIFNGIPVTYFTGIFTGSFGGTVVFSSGSISGSNLLFSASYFSGSINGINSIQSGSVSGSLVNGYITGSVISPYVIGIFTGQITGSDVCLTGTGSGIDKRNEPNWTTANVQYVDRSLLKFNLDVISASISNGTIVNPNFSLKVKVCNEYNLPITYKVYAFPISQSWNMGDGYLSDGGSDSGVSWLYRDYNNGTSWYTASISPRYPVDFITTPSLLTASFGYGGGTWYTSSWCSQSFEYETSDIDMDVTTMVKSWLSSSIPNEGLILISSDELQASGSGFMLKFFSRDTNTIYSPYLDVKWDDIALSGFITGSQSTGSVTISTISSSISASVRSGSFLSNIGGLGGAGGVSGSFSSSAAIITMENYITASNQIFNYSAPDSTPTVDLWFANNGFYIDSWLSAWDLDPNHGGFLPNTDIQATPVPDFGSAPIYKFTGSFTGSFSGTASYVRGTITGSGKFTASYFTGSVNGISYEVTSGSVSGSFITGSLIGTVTSIVQLGLYTGQLTSSLIYLNGTGSGYFLDSTFVKFIGFADGIGLSGNIRGVPIFGSVNGVVTISQSLVTGPCGNSFSSSLAKAIFITGPFSGSSFTSYYVDYKFENATLIGSWNNEVLLGETVNVILPSPIYPYAYADVIGLYVNGKALGLYTTSGSTSASFNGQLISGNLIGTTISVQLTGSVYTSSFTYTSSVNITSSLLFPMDTNRPFTIAVQNMNPTYKAGDIAKMGVFGRKKFPLKYFGRSTQQEQYLIPEYLPTSSFYALKDDITDEIILNFDNFTKVGCEYPAGNYFIIDTTSLPQDRYYRVLIRISDARTTYTIDAGKTFKIVR